MKNTKELIPACIETPRVATDAVIFAVIDGALKVLLIRIGRGTYEGQWALPGGLVRMDESLDRAAERILSEKAGVDGIYLEQLGAFGDLDRDRRGRNVSIAYFALVNGEEYLPHTIEYYSDIAWKDVSRLPELAFDHAKIVTTGIDRLRNKLGYSNIAYGLLPKEFTLTELQTVYESILDRPLDKRNFRKKIVGIGLVKETGKIRKSGPSRPARLYSFADRKPKMVDVL
ncbi:MAG: NUDIX hydrolase [Candidatus Moranbacteria bacterium]|nr:NUDIX hydrolase [Candidatus Moranbacteria bacterium]NTW45927.1 NUDIX hydrolase [Candidatus Moranbacteria bacterium]